MSNRADVRRYELARIGPSEGCWPRRRCRPRLALSASRGAIAQPVGAESHRQAEPEPRQAAGWGGNRSRRLLPAALRRGMLTRMAKPLAKLLLMLTPKRRWAQFSLVTMFVLAAIVALPIS